MWGGLAAAMLAGQALMPAAVVFQADFNGSGSGTGGANDMVTYGGTGVIFNNTNSNLVPSVGTSAPILPGTGGYLSIQDNGLQTTGGTGGGATFTPTSTANSFNGGYTTGATFNSINGAFDFYFSMSSVTGFDANSLRFLDLNGGNSGLRMTLLLGSADKFRFELTSKNASGTIVGSATLTSSAVTFLADTVYHMGITYTTDGTGKVTTKIFLTTGNTGIDTSTNTYLIASYTTTGVFDPLTTNHAFGSNAFNFGYVNNAVADSKLLKIDSFRLYDSVPASFTTIPEPGTAALALVGLGAMLIRRRRA